jgi:hypothetical protein
MDFLDMVISKNPDIITRVLKGETVLIPINIKRGGDASFYLLNRVGASIWNRINGKRTLREIRDFMLTEYDVSEGKANCDLRGFVQQLKEIKAVTF